MIIIIIDIHEPPELPFPIRGFKNRQNSGRMRMEKKREQGGTKFVSRLSIPHPSPLATCPAIELAGLSGLGERLPANLLRHDVREPATTSLTLSGTR